VPKLSERTVNGELLRCLAKTANDEQPGIRTNTTICLGKLAKSLGTSTRAKVLTAAFLRSLRDPFVHARNAALSALAATTDYFSEEDCAARLLPAVCPLLIDKEKVVRDQASKTVDLFLTRIRKAASTMPDSVLPPPLQSASTGSTPRMGTPQPGAPSSAAAAAGSWAGWAVSSFTNKLSAVAGEMESQGEAPASSAGSAPDAKKTQGPASSASALHRQALGSPTSSTPNLSRTPSQLASAVASDFLAGGSPDQHNDGDDDGWGAFGDPSATADGVASPGSPSSSRSSFQARRATADDGSEPDFAGWLAAQAAKKSALKTKPLPKGMAARTGGAAATASAGARKGSASSVATTRTTASTTVAARPKVVKKPEPKVEAKPKAEEETWGDDW
jgi:SCY1-like protein 1